jgi:hypothetical protein
VLYKTQFRQRVRKDRIRGGENYGEKRQTLYFGWEKELKFCEMVPRLHPLVLLARIL